MTDRPLKVGIIGLGEAGNLGDDLILIATVDAIYAAEPTAQVSFLSFGHELDWSTVADVRDYPALPARRRGGIEIPLVRQNSEIFADEDVIIFGGGGLLQTSLVKDRPYGWLSYLPVVREGGPRVLAAGLGLGPLSSTWTQRLRDLGTPFDSCWLRDPQSVRLAQSELGWPARECRDFIDSEFIRSLPFGDSRPEDRGVRLGVALRDWPGMEVESTIAHVNAVAVEHGCDEVVFFVLEAKHGGGVDVDFTRRVAEGVRKSTETHVYEARNLIEFLSEMAQIDVAISMKLHSSAIWGALGIPMYPVFYAPKVSALFGAPYKGLEIVREIRVTQAEERQVPRAQQVVTDGLRRLRGHRGPIGSRFTPAAKVAFQVKRLGTGAGSKLRRLFGV